MRKSGDNRETPTGTSVSLEEMAAFLGNSVASYKLPEMLEVFDELPFTPTGKLQRYVLVRRVLERKGAEAR